VGGIIAFGIPLQKWMEDMGDLFAISPFIRYSLFTKSLKTDLL
jgi:hypothetical protein